MSTLLFIALRYTRTMLLILVSFIAGYAMAEDIKNLSIPIAVQFSNTGVTPASPEFVDGLSREVGVTLSFLQQTSEGSHVFLVSGLFAGFPLNDILQRVQRRSDVISAVEEAAGGGSSSAQIVIKFSTAVSNPSHPIFALALSRDVGVTLAYLFEKTRGIQVFRVNGLSQPAQMPFILQRLKQRKDVIAAETRP